MTSRHEPFAEAARPGAGSDDRDRAGLEHGPHAVRRASASVTSELRCNCDRREAPGRDRLLAVGDGDAGRLHARDAADAAAGVRRRARVVEPGDRGAVVGIARRRAHVEQLLERQLAVEDVAADQAVLVLHLVGPDDVAVQDRRLEVRRHLVIEVDAPVGVGLELLLVRRLAPVARHPLREQRHDVHALGRERAVERRRDHAVAERPRSRPALARVLERPLDELHARRHLDRTGVVLLQLGAAVGREVGQLAEREVDLHDTAARLPPLDVAHEVVGQVARGRRGRGRRSCGCRLVTTTGARSSVPSASTAPCTRPPFTSSRSTRASVRISAPNDSAERRIAADTPPMPPSGKPQLPSCPSPTSPMEWCAMT